MLQSDDDTYLCLGSKARRNAVGVSPHQAGLFNVPVEAQQSLRTYVVESEALFDRFVPACEEAKVREGIHLNEATTLSMPAIPGWKSKYYNSIAGCHGGVALAMHVNQGDFGMGHISVQMEKVPDGNPILVYFCFPTLGFAVPLRHNEHMLFNPMVPHMLSTVRSLEHRILPLSMYLKKDAMGLNNNKLPLSSKHKLIQKQISSTLV